MWKFIIVFILLLFFRSFSTAGTDSKDIYAAISTGDIKTVETIIQNGFDINSTNAEGYRPLHFAVKENKADIVRLLIEKGAEINTTISIIEYYGDFMRIYRILTPLHIACENTNRVIIGILLEKGADIYKPDRKGNPPIYLSIWGNDFETVTNFIGRGFPVNFTNRDGYSLLNAAANRSLIIVKYFIEKGLNVNSSDKDGYTLLHIAAWEGNTAAVQYLLDKGAVINAVNKNGDTPLMLALEQNESNFIETVKILINKGADINVRNNNLESSLIKALNRYNSIMAGLLIQKGALINVTNKNGESPLFIAVQKAWGTNEYFQISKTLLDRGADPGIMPPSYPDSSLLSTAIFNKNFLLAKYLLEKGAVMNDRLAGVSLRTSVESGQTEFALLLLKNKIPLETKGEEGHTPLWISVMNTNEALALALLDKGAEYDIRDQYDYYLPGVVAEKGMIKVMNTMIGKGLDINKRRDETQEPLLMKAVSYNKKEMAELLIRKGADINAVYELSADFRVSYLTALDCARDEGMRKYLIKLGAKTASELGKNGYDLPGRSDDYGDRENK